MEDIPFKLESGEKMLRAEDAQIVPDNSAPQGGQLWITNRRIIARWTEGGSLFRTAAAQEIVIALTDISETRLPGGPLVQILAQNGVRLSLQTFRPIVLRQTIAEAVQAAKENPAGAASSQEARSEEGSAPSKEAPATLWLPTSESAAKPVANCSRCGSAISGSERFCPHCGLYRNAQAAYCRRCSRDYPVHYRFCAVCGDSLTSTQKSEKR